MIKIKFSHNAIDWPFERQTPNSSKIYDNCKFYINEEVEECDYWIVFDGLNKAETVRCPQKNTILITAEPPSIKKYNIDFLNQFATVITCDDKLEHANLILTQQCLPWMVGRKVKKLDNISFSKSYDELKNFQNPTKTKILSVITSDKLITEGHRQRYNFVMKLKELLGDKIDVFGRGINDIEDKWDAIAPYKYHIALENCSIPNYWTEKLADCYLARTYPLYYGCTNLNHYFNDNLFTFIDINDFDKSIKIIEEIINSNTYENNIQQLENAKDLVLDKYNLFAFLNNFISEKENSLSESEYITIYPEYELINNLKVVKQNKMKETFKCIELFIRKIRNIILCKNTISKISTIEKNIHIWNEANEKENLRLNYDLNENSVVFDVGGYEGDWTNQIFNKYNSNIYIFEPVSKFVDIIKHKFKNNNKIKILNFGLSDKTKQIKISIDDDSSSIYKNTNCYEEISLTNITEFLQNYSINHIDLMKINIEGGEFELLDELLNNGFISNINNIQVQFHEFVPNAKKRMKALQKRLSKTHELTYQYEFIWENWRLKK